MSAGSTEREAARRFQPAKLRANDPSAAISAQAMKIFASSVVSTSDTLLTSGAMKTLRKGCRPYCSARSTQNSAPVDALEALAACVALDRRVVTAMLSKVPRRVVVEDGARPALRTRGC